MTNENIENENSTNNGAEGNENEAEVVKIAKADYDQLNQTLGSLKRELKDLKKTKEESKETANQTKPDENVLLQRIEKMALRGAGITHPDDIELARNTAKKWGVDIDEILIDEDFKVKLERQQTNRTNIEATSKLKGGTGASQAKNEPSYWIAKGTVPSRTDIPDRKTRVAIVKAMQQNSKSSKTFYND
jgi:hypothetical protein